MNQILGPLGTAFDFLLVVLGFGFIIFIHELGHFIAARWAGIRVLAFAIGFGPAAASFRKGLGWRRGSSEQEYQGLDRQGKASTISPTEYRFNWLPFGGYVKMLGQDDTDPTATSDAPDSYQSCRIWKRMVVISAGVVMNMILAAALFVGVFMHGIKMEPAKIGAVAPGSAASRAASLGDEAEPGLKPGDTIISINGRAPNSFNDLILATAMTSKNDSLHLTVRRPGVSDLIEYLVKPEIGEASGLQEIGVAPPLTNHITPVKNPEELEVFRREMDRMGLASVEPDMTLVSVGGKPVVSAGDAQAAVAAADGKAVDAVFESADKSHRTTVTVQPEAALQTGLVPLSKKTTGTLEHLLGLTPIMTVRHGADPSETRQGLQDDDIFARIGSIEFPSIAEAQSEIRAHSGKTIEVSVLRKQADGTRALVPLDPPPKVSDEGKIGFSRTDSEDLDTLVAMPPARVIDARHLGEGAPTAASRLITRPGTRIVSVAGKPVPNFTELRAALRNATRGAFDSGAPNTTVAMGLEPPSLQGPKAAVQIVDWTLSRSDLQALFGLGWRSSLDTALFEPEEFQLQAKGPVDALRMGLSETHRVMMSTYITFARLFEGTVKVEHLKGPVGIAHMGTRIASRGLIWLFFFMALISVNLAVINFLPLPIVDGGQFLFLVFEQIRGKPVPIAVQNIATIAGLILIGTMFIIVTFHDIANLFKG